MKTVIIADSRGAQLSAHLKYIDNIGTCTVMTCPGAGIVRSVRTAKRVIMESNPDVVIVMAGICDITMKHPTTKRISLRTVDAGMATQNVMNAIGKAYEDIREIGDYTVSFATITGVDLTDANCRTRRHMNDTEYQRYCVTTKQTHPDQEAMDAIITIVNRAITEYNERNATPTTWMAEVVHPYIRGRHRARYDRLSDGCHPTSDTSRRWAAQVARAIRRIEPKISN